MDDAQLLSVLEHDDSYRPVRVLADRPSGRTELVRGSGIELLVRKYIPLELANEAAWETLRTMDSELLPQVRDLYRLPDTLVVITTYVDGASLAELVGQTGPVDASTAASLVFDLCQAVSLLHEHDIVHRDISPGNVIINNGYARIIDLGNARTYVEGAQHDTTNLGTWGFAAPEQFGFAQTDARSDVYSLGSVLGYLLTGIQPGDEDFGKALADEKYISPKLRIIVQKARSFEPSARYQSADELAAALRPWIRSTQRIQKPSTQKQPETNQRVGWIIPWGEAGLSRQLPIIASWLFFLFWASCFLVIAFDYASNPIDDGWPPLTYLFLGLAEAPMCVMVAYEIQQALLHRGRYNVEKGRMLILLKRLVLLLALAFAGLFVSYLIAYVLKSIGIVSLAGS